MNSFPEKWRKLNVVLSHDWLTGMRGGERVLEILCEGFPSAPVFTLIHNHAAISEIINSHDIHTSWLQNVPGILKYYRYFLPFFPQAVSQMHAPQADLMISTSHCTAKAVRVKPETKHICYCFTPMRYAWVFYDEYFGHNPIKAVIAKPFLKALQTWDRKTSARVDRFVAISKHVQTRIKTFYGRESDIVYPPIDTSRFSISDKHENFDLIVSALVPYKRIDLAVKAYSRSGTRLKIVGTGGELEKLRAIAAPNIEFLGWQSDDKITSLYRNCRMLIFPGEEDFGLVPLEAQACGKPVVAYGKGGALESVIANTSGIFFEEQTEQCLLTAVDKCASIKWDPSVIRAHAEKFGITNFIQGMTDVIEKTL